MTVKVNYPHIKIEENKPPRLQRIPRVRVAQIVGVAELKYECAIVWF
ncbi:MAG: hypothetical protein F6K48_13845 [Okeania sp. SIO3H1]|nr:hypothetical protein [Okeania sp. SIO3H1]